MKAVRGGVRTVAGAERRVRGRQIGGLKTEGTGGEKEKDMMGAKRTSWMDTTGQSLDTTSHAMVGLVKARRASVGFGLF